MKFSEMFEPLKSLHKDQFCLEFMVVFLARHRVRLGVVCCAVEPGYLFYCFVGSTGIFVFDVKGGIDPVLAHQQPKAILPAVACEESAIAKWGLGVEIRLGRLPRLDAIFDLDPRSNKLIRALLSREG